MASQRDPFRREPGAPIPRGRTRWFVLLIAVLVERITRSGPVWRERWLVLVRTCVSIRVAWRRRRWWASPTFVGFVHIVVLCIELTQAGSSENIVVRIFAAMMLCAHMPVAEIFRHLGYVWNRKGCELGFIVGAPLSLGLVAIEWLSRHG